MKPSHCMSLLLLPFLIGGCAPPPINPPIEEVSADSDYTFQTRQKHFKSQDNLVVLAFSGGGTRAAAFSYGVLEFLRRTEAIATVWHQGSPARRAGITRGPARGGPADTARPR